MMDRLRTVAFSTLLWVIATVMNSTLAFSTLLYGIAIAMKLAAWNITKSNAIYRPTTRPNSVGARLSESP